MHSRVLHNTARIELWPAWLLRARGNRDARTLACASFVMRRKHDGHYIATIARGQVRPLRPWGTREPGIDAALAALEAAPSQARDGPQRARELPLDRLQERLQRLGLGSDYAARTGLPLVLEPDRLAFAGFDRYRRALWLHADAARAWQCLREAARRDSIALEAISGYRSHDYQLDIFERKRARGQTVADILKVNAAPGYSEHHSGFALDIGVPDQPPAEESFERTPAFAWLRGHAAGHGFAMSYPRDNPHGIVYEPWHWRWRRQ